MAIEGNKALFAVDGKEYNIGASATILCNTYLNIIESFSSNWTTILSYFRQTDAAAGSATDWTFIKNGPNIKHSYTFELRDKGQHGFVMPQSGIDLQFIWLIWVDFSTLLQ